LLAVGTWSVVLSQGLFYASEPRTAVLTLLGPEAFPLGRPPGLYLYGEGLRHGLIQSLRFDVMLLLGAGLLARYGGDELMAGLRALRLPAPLGFLFAMALRFVPMMAAEARATWRAQHLRGFRAVRGGVPRPLAAVRVLLLPLLAGNVRRADEVAAALHSRGVVPTHAPVAAAPAAAPGERVLCWGGAAALLTLAASVVLTRLHVAGLFTLPSLYPVYAWVLAYV